MQERAGTTEIEGEVYKNFVAIGVGYAEAIVKEQIPACTYIILAAQRFLDMRAAAFEGSTEYYWCDESAIEPCVFIETLHHVKGELAGKTLKLEAWQCWVIIAIYGFRRREGGYRLVTFFLGEITRKTGKSLLSAGIGLYELTLNANMGDDAYIIAPTEALAHKVLEPMQKMVDHNDHLQHEFGITYKNGQMDVAQTDSYAKTLSSAGKKQDGHDPKLNIADEFHSLPAAIYNVMKSAQGARAESLFVAIGSAGYHAFGVGWDERQLAIDVLEGRRDKAELLAVIYTIDPEDFGNWRSERVIQKANPNYGVSLPKHKMKQEIDGIYENPRNKAEVLRTRFNVWGLGEQKLISMRDWEACELPSLTEEMMEGRVCYTGVDLASRNDMVAKVNLFELDGNLLPFAQHYVPSEGIWQDDEEVRDLYADWIERGFLTATPGSFHTYEELLRDILEDGKRFEQKCIAVDDREANWLMGELLKVGRPVLSIRKNAPNFSDPTKDIQARATGKIKGMAHDGNPVLAWNVDNVIGGMNTADLLLPKKMAEHSSGKIDGFDAMVQANAVRLQNEAEPDTVQPMAARGMRRL